MFRLVFNIQLDLLDRGVYQATAAFPFLNLKSISVFGTDSLSDVLFETGRAELKSGAMQNLYQLATFLKNHPDRQVSVEGS